MKPTHKLGDMIMQLKPGSSAIAINSSTQNQNVNHQSLLSLECQSFCKLQIEHLIKQSPVFWCRMVYHDPLLGSHQEVTNYAPNQSPLSTGILAYLRSEEWLIDFYPALTLNEVHLDDFTSAYVCPLGYRNQKPEYILLLADKPLSSSFQQDVKQSAVLLSKYLNIYLECGRQQAEIQLLEHTVQRAGHQLRNPLAMISLYAENLYLGLPPGLWQEQAAIIRETVQDLDTNLTELIDCGQGTKLRVSIQSLRTVVVESLQELKPLINQKQLQIHYPETSTTLAMDRLQMKQVFSNLLSNAIHFSPDLGTIYCNWQIFQSEVLIQIVDSGPGLSSEDLKKIFTPFYSRRPGGTGLGLTIAKKIVLDHQGSLWAQNSLQRGAQFCLILPRPITS
jgi:signal transduction histidine kinase